MAAAPVTPRSSAFLTPAQLTTLVDGLIGRPREWEPLVADAEAERQCRLLLRDGSVEVRVVSWAEGHDTGYHDHGGSESAVGVARGRLVEERMRIGGAPILRRLLAGRPPVHLPSGQVHRVRHAGGPPAVSLHAYSPPLAAMGTYAVRPDGVLERFPVGGDAMPAPPAGR